MSMNEISRATLQARSQNCERRLLALSCLSVSPSVSPFIRTPLCQSVILSVPLSVHTSVRQSVCLSLYPYTPPSVCPAVRMEQHCSRWMDFNEIFYFSYFRKSVAKIKVSLRSNKNKGYFTGRPKQIMIKLVQLLVESKMFQINL
jgi:hypothetical protein